MMDLGMFAHYLGDMLICVETDTCKGCAFWNGRCGKPIASKHLEEKFRCKPAERADSRRVRFDKVEDILTTILISKK